MGQRPLLFLRSAGIWSSDTCMLRAAAAPRRFGSSGRNGDASWCAKLPKSTYLDLLCHVGFWQACLVHVLGAAAFSERVWSPPKGHSRMRIWMLHPFLGAQAALQAAAQIPKTMVYMQAEDAGNAAADSSNSPLRNLATLPGYLWSELKEGGIGQAIASAFAAATATAAALLKEALTVGCEPKRNIRPTTASCHGFDSIVLTAARFVHVARAKCTASDC